VAIFAAANKARYAKQVIRFDFNNPIDALFVAVTDNNWFNLLASRRGTDEVSFWRPSSQQHLLSVEPARRAVIDVSLRGLMLTQPIHDKFHALRLRGMAEAFREQQESTDLQRLGFEERLGLLIDRQWNWRANRALERRLRNAR
jgi:hypothetical protein